MYEQANIPVHDMSVDDSDCTSQLPSITTCLLFIFCIFIFSKQDEDVFTTTARVTGTLVGIMMTSFSAVYIRLSIHVMTSYWLPLMAGVITWFVFPVLVQDFVFLLNLAVVKFAEAGQKLLHQLLLTNS